MGICSGERSVITDIGSNGPQLRINGNVREPVVTGGVIRFSLGPLREKAVPKPTVQKNNGVEGG